MRLIASLPIAVFIALSSSVMAQDTTPAPAPAPTPPAAAAPSAPAPATHAPAPKAPAPTGVSDEADKLLWCGQAFTEAGGQVKAGGDSTNGTAMIGYGAQLLDKGAAALTTAGFAADKVATTKTDYAAQVSKEFTGGAAATRFTFEECKALVQ
jgi:hypothetical protein